MFVQPVQSCLKVLADLVRIQVNIAQMLSDKTLPMFFTVVQVPASEQRQCCAKLSPEIITGNCLLLLTNLRSTVL